MVRSRSGKKRGKAAVASGSPALEAALQAVERIGPRSLRTPSAVAETQTPFDPPVSTGPEVTATTTSAARKRGAKPAKPRN